MNLIKNSCISPNVGLSLEKKRKKTILIEQFDVAIKTLV